MSGFNLSKMAAKDETKNYDMMLEEQTEKMDLATSDDAKNINLSLPVKDQDATATVEAQMHAGKTDTDSLKVIEKAINEDKKVYNERRITNPENVSVINIVSEAYDKQHQEAVKEANDEMKKETAFWDKYIGTQMEGPITKVDDDVTNTQLPNFPKRFDGLETDVNKIVNQKIPRVTKASLSDADAMLFHIYAFAKSQNRDLTKIEKQQVIDINSYKMRCLNKI